VIAAAIFLLAALQFWAVAWLSDDALISLRQVYLLGEGQGMTWNIGQRVQAFTHPLWFLLLSAGYALTGSLYEMTLVMSAVLWVAALAIYARTALARPGWIGLMLLALPILTLSIRDYTTSGLETPLSLFLAATLFRLNGKLLWLALAALLLTRPDHAVQFGPLAFVLLARGEGRLRDLWPGLVLLLGWHGFALVYFGMPLPNTFYAKAGGGIGLLPRLLTGGGYFLNALLYLPVTVLLLALGTRAGLLAKAADGQPKTRHRDAAIALGILAHVVYLVWIGGDFMQGRFLAVDTFLACFLIARNASVTLIRRAGIAAVLIATVYTRPYIVPMQVEDIPFFNDERRFYAQPYALRSKGRVWPQPNPPSEVAPIGYRAECGMIGGARIDWPDKVWIIDVCALTDPFLARLPALQQAGYRPGHLNRAIPDNYHLALAGIEPLTDANARALFEDIQAVSTGPIFTKPRFQAIWRLLSGHHQPDPDHWRHPGAGLTYGMGFWMGGEHAGYPLYPPGLREVFGKP